MQVEASCAICGSQSKNCKHEDERLKQALDEAHQRWMLNAEMRQIRFWVLDHARDWIIYTFNQMATTRRQQYEAHLNSIPHYDLYKIYSGRPPISGPQMHDLRIQMSAATQAYQRGVDEDWKNSLTRYPEILDYYFGLVEFKVPSDKSLAVMEPQFGGGGGGGGMEVKGREKGRKRHSGGVGFMMAPPPIPVGPFGMPGVLGPGAMGGHGPRPPGFGMPMHPGPF